MEQDRSTDPQFSGHQIGLDFQHAPGWWIATDDKWYPPELHPDFQPPFETLASTGAPPEADGSAPASSQTGSRAGPPIHSASTALGSASAVEPAPIPDSAPPTHESPPPAYTALPFEPKITLSPEESEPRHAVTPPTTTMASPEAGVQTAAVRVARKVVLTSWEKAWYVVMCVLAGIGYFAKIPAKKAMEDFRFCRMTSAEHFWYDVMCIPFGAAYFAKIPTAKALSELPQFRPQTEPAPTEGTRPEGP
jgi:hypothetical protein